MTINNKNTDNVFYIFVTTHLIFWTLIPSITNHNLPLDTIEALAWGSNLDWGFNKHPPMSAFFPEVFYQIFGPQDWAYYLLSQIFVIISFFYVFKLSNEIFNKNILGLISVLLIEAIYFYNFTTPEFNVNVCQLPFWSLVVYYSWKIYSGNEIKILDCFLSVLLLEGIYFYNFTTPEFNVNVCLIPFWSLSLFYLWKGIRNNKILDWIFLGLFAGLGFLSKYLFVYLGLAIAVLLIYLIINKKTNFKCLVSLIPFFLILSPHVIWLSENDYVTITYGLMRTGSDEVNIFNHLMHPFIFLLKQIGILIPFLLMILVLIKKFKININLNDDKLLFLLSINLIPLLFIFLTSFTMGVKIRTMWMTPFYISFGLLFVYIFKSEINFEKMKAFTSLFLVLFFISPILYAYVSISKTDKRTDFNGKNLAIQAKNFYEREANELGKMEYIKGNEWIAGNISYHLPERPKWIYSSKDIYMCNKDMECIKYK